MIKTILATAIAVIGLAAQAQHTVGSGGDYIRRIYEQARTEMAAKVEALSACSFVTMETTPAQKEWILTHKAELKRDIETSAHLWVVDNQPTCAFTMHAPGSSIYLSYPTCKNAGENIQAASHTLVHESAHHLGIADEQQADLIAQAIMDAVVVDKCAEVGSAFDSTVCQGPPASTQDIGRLFKPGEPSATFGQYSMFSRARVCSSLSGCGEWKDTSLMVGNRYHYPTKTFVASYGKTITGPLKSVVKAVAEFPYYDVDFCVSGNFSCQTVKDNTGSFYVNVTANSLIDDQSLFTVDLLKGRAMDATSGFPSKDQFGNNITVGHFYFKAKGQIKKNCSWFQYADKLYIGDGFTQDVEYVIYGAH